MWLASFRSCGINFPVSSRPAVKDEAHIKDMNLKVWSNSADTVGKIRTLLLHFCFSHPYGFFLDLDSTFDRARAGFEKIN